MSVVSKVSRIATAAAVLVALPAVASAQNFLLTSTLSGPLESPVNASPGTGPVSIRISGNNLTINASFSDLLGLTSASHIHCCTTLQFTGVLPFAGAGTTAGVATQLPSFVGFPLGVHSGSFLNTFDLLAPGTYNPAFVTANGSVAAARAALINGLLTGHAYLNVHTVDDPNVGPNQQGIDFFPSGEARAFFLNIQAVPEPSTYALMATGLGVVGMMGWRRRRSV
jgi:hypothetical protein